MLTSFISLELKQRLSRKRTAVQADQGLKREDEVEEVKDETREEVVDCVPKDAEKQVESGPKQGVFVQKAPIIHHNRKRKIKERVKELEELKEALEAHDSSESSSSDSSDSSESSDSESPKASKKTPNRTTQNKLTNTLKITQPNPKLNIKSPIEAFAEKRENWAVPANQFKAHSVPPTNSKTPYLDQFNVIPKSKLSSKQKETIIDSHLKTLQPSRKPLIKGKKITPDTYNLLAPKQSRRNSHGNRAFTLAHKTASAQKSRTQAEYLSQGYLLLLNDHNEEILLKLHSQYSPLPPPQIPSAVTKNVILRAVIFDPAKGQPLDTGLFMGVLEGVEESKVYVRVRKDFWGKLGYEEEVEEQILDEGVVQVEIGNVCEVYVQTEQGDKKQEGPEEVQQESVQEVQQVEQVQVQVQQQIDQQQLQQQKEDDKEAKKKEEKQKIINEFLIKQRRSLINRIKKQMEHYFGDKNYSKDEFIQKQVKASKDGSVPIEVLMTFNKLKNMGANKELILESVSNSQICQANEDKSGIKRVNA